MTLFDVQFSWDDSFDFFSPRSIRIVVIGLIVGFMTAALQYILAVVPVISLLSPLGVNRPDIFPLVHKKLETAPNTYALHKSNSLIPQSRAAETYNQATSYVVVDYDTGDIIDEQRGDDSFAIASLTKIMTAVVALDLATPRQEITISKNAATQIPTKIGVVAGQKMTLEELLHALLMTSANDSAQAIQDGIDQVYGESVFVRAMNAKAVFLNLSHSSFDNPQGFDGPANYSSAENLAILTHYAMEHYPLIKEIVGKDYAILPATATHKKFDLYNWNGLLGVYPNIFGMKIGNTSKAGKTTIVISERDGQKILVVLLGASGVLQRDLWAAQLLDEGFALKKGLPKINVTEKQLRNKYNQWKYWG